MTTPERLIERARELRPYLLERQAETEQRGSYSEETHALLRDAAFYRMLAPRRVGGLAVDLGTFLRVVSELARGCPASAWCIAVLAGGALRVGAVFDGPEQAELFGDGDGDLRCASAATPFAIATRADGGWIVDGTLSSCVGARYATHFLGRALVEETNPDGAPPPLLFVASRSQFDVLDNSVGPLGLPGSGSQGVRFERALIAERFARSDASPAEGEASDATRNPWMTSVLQAGLAAVFVGAASTAAEIYEGLVRTESTPWSPIGPRQRDPDYQRWLGATIGRVTAAELLLEEAAQQYTGAGAGADDGVPLTRADELRLGMLARESMRLAWSAVHDVVRTAGPGAASRLAELERIGRAMLSGWGDPRNLSEEWLARQLARERLGLPVVA